MRTLFGALLERTTWIEPDGEPALLRSSFQRGPINCLATGPDHLGTGRFRQSSPVPISRFSGALVVFVLDRILIGSFGDAPGRVRVVGRQGVAVVRCWGRRGRNNR